MKLTNIQKQGLEYAQTVQYPAFFMTMRAGKSILTIKDLIFNECFPALICASLSTIYGWEQDLQKCGFTKNDYQILIGEKSQKIRNFKNLTSKSIVLTNKEFYISIPEIIKYINFKSVILDESTCIKNFKSNISKFYCKNFKKIQRKYVLTGTPMPNSELDIFCQLQFLDPTILNFKNFWSFKTKYFYCYNYHDYRIKPSIKAYFYQRLAQTCHFVTLQDVRRSIGKENIKMNRIVRTCALTEESKEIYKQLKENFLMTVDNNILFGFSYILQQIVYLRKLCSGFIKIKPDSEETKLIDLSKYILLMDILKHEIPDYKIIILCNFYDEIYQTEKIFKKTKKFQNNFDLITGQVSSLKRGEIMQKFQNNEIQYIIANTACIKHGVTLSTADLIIEFSTILGAEIRDQVEFRGTNIYTNDNMTIMHLIVERSIEEYFLKKIEKQISNKQLMNDLIMYLRKEKV